jgi:hypothetical protein
MAPIFGGVQGTANRFRSTSKNIRLEAMPNVTVHYFDLQPPARNRPAALAERYQAKFRSCIVLSFMANAVEPISTRINLLVARCILSSFGMSHVVCNNVQARRTRQRKRRELASLKSAQVWAAGASYMTIIRNISRNHSSDMRRIT